MTVRDEALEGWPREKEATRSHIYDYYSLITAMDYDFGRLLDYLDQKGLTENTIILFTSDHGLALGSHGLFGKQNIYEAGMKVPFFIAGPGIKPGKTNALIYLHDIFPTMADYAGGELKAEHDGKSLRPIIEEKVASVRDTLELAYMDSQRSIRDDRWKLMIFPQINKLQLFDLKTDPDEMNDLAEKHPEVVSRLIKTLKQQQPLKGDKQLLTVDNPKKAEFDVPKMKPSPRIKAGGESKTNTVD